MFISELEIKNYRNLDGINIKFHPDITFLVGENNLGKSNILSLITTVLNAHNFSRDDFYDKNNEISVTLTLVLNEYEKGMFGDLFDPEDNSKVNIIFSQKSPDEFITLTHKETGVNITNNTIKKILHINYDSLRNPNNELSFEKGKGTGKFFKFLIERYLKNNGSSDLDFIDETKIGNLIEYINILINKIKSIRDFQITSGIHSEVENLLSRVLTLTDSSKFGVTSSGYGVQYSIMIGLEILVRMSYLTESRLEKLVYEKSEERVMPIIFSLDEPEIHLHPYMQRSLIKNISDILNNTDEEYKELLKELFNIDAIIGQTIIATHSPNILLNDYRKIVRLFKQDDGDLIVKNGTEINLPKNIEKHLLMNMQYIKEIFFSKCVIIVEGESEYGCMDIFADKLNIDLDDSAISILKANGAESILPLMKLFEEFGIKSVGVIDKDKFIEKEHTFTGVANLLHTDFLDFEDELISKCFEDDRIDVLLSIIEQYDSQGLTRSIQSKKLVKTARKYGLEITEELTGNYNFTQELDGTILRLMFLSWFDINKSVILGREIGYILERSLIPEVYMKAIIQAQEML